MRPALGLDALKLISVRIMKKIINGRKYDTETAKQICVGYFGNFGCKVVTLYQKENGEFFEHHRLDSREWIDPIGRAEAMDFAAEQMDVDDYEKVFGEVSE